MNITALPPADPPSAHASDWPLQPRPEVVHGFELPAEPWLPGHRGVDLLGRPGQPVLAATPGTVTYAGPLAGRGVVTITYGTRRTTYEPVAADVPVGASVQTGTVIGRLSAAGTHCPPRTCLHWGLLQGKQYLNPLSLLPRPPVRLLPLLPRAGLTAPLPAPPLAPASRAAAAPPPPAVPVANSADRNRRAARLVVAATAALTLAGGLLLRRQ
ncbi:peptidoglycan DD-metalloendopeptidase family protein [Kribbella sp. NPDC004536]|uniref:peptidoglycan DD-metalloendopeptidase family protein n=1 Tax=Kribbella sp. NPDC004536 TaxID=3364106 RepID=UPI0036C660E5